MLSRTPRRLGTSRPQLEQDTSLVALAAAQQVVDEAARFLGVSLPAHYATDLAHHAHRTYAHSPSFRRGFHGRDDAGRDRLYVYLRHWLAARLYREHHVLFVRLPADYRTGAPLPAPKVTVAPAPPAFVLSPDERLLTVF